MPRGHNRSNKKKLFARAASNGEKKDPEPSTSKGMEVDEAKSESFEEPSTSRGKEADENGSKSLEDRATVKRRQIEEAVRKALKEQAENAARKSLEEHSTSNGKKVNDSVMKSLLKTRASEKVRLEDEEPQPSTSTGKRGDEAAKRLLEKPSTSKRVTFEDEEPQPSTSKGKTTNHAAMKALGVPSTLKSTKPSKAAIMKALFEPTPRRKKVAKPVVTETHVPSRRIDPDEAAKRLLERPATDRMKKIQEVLKSVMAEPSNANLTPDEAAKMFLQNPVRKKEVEEAVKEALMECTQKSIKVEEPRFVPNPKYKPSPNKCAAESEHFEAQAVRSVAEETSDGAVYYIRVKKKQAPEHVAVSDLDEPGLRALLDEAISYKTPKDAQGKSELFKELLHSVDNDNKNSMSVHSERSRKPRRQSSKKDTDKSYCTHGSLQDLNNVLSNSSASAEGDHKGREPASWKTGLCKSNSSPPPQINMQDTIASHGYEENGQSTVILSQAGPSQAGPSHSGPSQAGPSQAGPSQAAHPRQQLIENGSCEDLYYLRAGNKSASNKESPASTSFEHPEIRRTLSSGCLEEEPYLEIPDSYKRTNSLNTGQAATEKDEVSSPSRERFGEKAKNFDENANSLSALQERKGKCRRLKAKNDKNTILSEHIEGHRSDIAQDIDAVMKYIESPTRNDNKSSRRMNFPKSSSRITNKLRPVRDKSSDTVRKGKKSKDKFQKSSSLEEVCISTFEDLTSSVMEQGQQDFIPIVNNNVRKNSRAHGSDMYTSQEGYSSSISKPIANIGDNYVDVSSVLKREMMESDADSDFLTVKKKQRKKKNTAFHNQRNKVHNCSGYPAKKGFSYQSKDRRCYSFEKHSISRRKSLSSVPPSEKSDDSSDGDSVHSLPISSEACSMRSLGDGCIKNASYAAIARAAPSPSKPVSESDAECVEKLSFSQEESPMAETIPTVLVQLPPKKDKSQTIRITNEDYPPLHHDSSNDMYVEYTVSVPKREKVIYESVVNVEKTVIVKLPATNTKNVTKKSAENNSVPGKRPAVIICDLACSPCDVEDLEFGFEVNQQLLKEDDYTSDSEESVEDDSDILQLVPDDMIKSACPLIAYLSEEWNKTVEEYNQQAAGGPVTVTYIDC